MFGNRNTIKNEKMSIFHLNNNAPMPHCLSELNINRFLSIKNLNRSN